MTRPDAPVPARPGRDVRLDLFRGWLQLTIFASHAQGSWAGAWLIHGAWGLSDSSEQFVFLSGLALGSVFARKHLRDGWAGATRDMLGRAGRLWRTDLATLALFGAMLLLLDRTWLPGEAASHGWRFLLDDPWRAMPAAVLMLYQPAYMDALSVFVWSMLALPLFALAVARLGAWALVLPASVWLLVQALHLPAPDLAPDSPPAFNVLAWQALFLLGAYLGRRKLLLGRAVPDWPFLLPAALLVLLTGLLLRLDQHGFLALGLPPVGMTWADKVALSPVRLLHALALAFVVARLTPAEAPWMHRPLPRLLAAVGRHSLLVFCAGLFLSYGATQALRFAGAAHPLLDPALILAGVAALAAFAHWLDRPPRARPVLGPPAGVPGAAP